MKGLSKMRRSHFLRTVIAVIALGLLGAPLAAQADHKQDPKSKNIHPLGDRDRPGTFGDQTVNSDIAFQGKLGFMGRYDGFVIMNLAAPGNPKEISFTTCNGNQGDISVWNNLVFRSTNTPNEPSRSDYPRMCDGQAVPAGFEGIHIFDASNLEDPVLIATIPTTCGSHTHTLVPDEANNRVLLYVNSNNTDCTGSGSILEGTGDIIDIIEVPLSDPASASVIHSEPLFDGAVRCHDLAAFTGDVNLALCAARPLANVFDISDPTDPVPLFSIAEDGAGVGMEPVAGWHTAGITWDGEVLALAWEPGGGGQAECEATDDPVKYTIFFYDAVTGDRLGFWTLPRPQSEFENCTIHNYAIVPNRKGNYVLVSGNYQSGTSVVDFTDLSNPVEIGFSDPLPIDPGMLTVGGPWSAYWYNNFIYETNSLEGLRVFRLSNRVTGGAIRLDRFNPQTQEFRLP